MNPPAPASEQNDRKRFSNSPNSAGSPASSRASIMLVRTVRSRPASAMHSLTDRVAWPTFRPRSHKKYSMNSTAAKLRGPGGIGGDEQQIYVAERRQHAAAVAAGRDNGHRILRRRGLHIGHVVGGHS